MLRKIANIQDFKKIIMIYNEGSGVQGIFKDTGARVRIIYMVLRSKLKAGVLEKIKIQNFDQMQEVGQRICDEKIEWVIVIGGDGTLRAFAECFVRNNYYPFISVYPGGTVNLVAKELMQKSDAYHWAAQVQKGIATPVWLGKANDRIFLTVAGIGVDSLIVNNVSPADKKYLSSLAYVKQGGRALGSEFLIHKWKYKFQVMIDNDGQWREASSVIVSKSHYYAGRFSLTEGSLSKPQLYVCLFQGEKAADFLRYTALIAADLLNIDRTVNIIPAQQVKIKCNVSNFAAQLDGDSVATSPLEISLLPKPMNFIS